MDHPNGFQAGNVPLPLASILTKPGLVLLLKHPSTDARIVEEHVVSLHCATVGKTFMSPIYRELDLSKGSVDAVRDILQHERDIALKQGRLYFIISPYFRPRLNVFQEFSQAIYLYTTGRIPHEHLLGILYAKGHDLNDLTLEQAYCQVKRAPEPEEPPARSHEMTITVSGKARSGRSVVSAVIRQALQRQWPDIPVRWDDPDDSQALVEANLDKGGYHRIDTTSFVINNTTKVESHGK